MKKTILMLFISLGSIGGYSQTDNANPILLNNSNPVSITPAYSRPCDENPPCYMYKKNNQVVMECPGKNVSPDQISMNSEGTYMGYYPTTNTKDVIPYLKNDGQRIWLRPAYSEPYTILQDPPCYIYKRHNLVVMECPGLQFPPEK